MSEENKLELMRLRVHAMREDRVVPEDYVAPIVDGVALGVLAWRENVQTPSLGIPYAVVAPPSRHWSGEPVEEWTGKGGVVFLTMDCEVVDPLPGGLRAFMDFGVEDVTWRVVSLIGWNEGQPVYREFRTFIFQRGEYESVIAGIPSLPAHPWDEHLLINKQWWDAVSGA